MNAKKVMVILKLNFTISELHLPAPTFQGLARRVQWLGTLTLGSELLVALK